MARAALCAYTTLAVTRFHEVLGGFEFLRAPLILGLICVVYVVIAPRETKRNVFQQVEAKAVWGLAAVGLLSIPLSVWPSGAVDFVLSTYSRLLALYFFVTILTQSASHLRQVVWAFIIGGGILGLATALELQFLDAGWGMGRRAYASATYDPNEVAMVMVCLVPFAWYGLMFARRWPSRVLLAGVGAVALLAILKTLSRGGFLGLVGVLTIMLVRTWQSGKRQLAVALALSALAPSLIAPASYWKTMETILTGAETETYLDTGIVPRWEVWKEGLALFLRNPITGVGIGQFEVAYGLTRSRPGKWSAAHNSFLQIATDLGAAGLALFVWLLVRAFRNARLAARMARAQGDLSEQGWIAYATEASLLGYVICGSALSTAYGALLYLLLAVSLVLRLQAERHQPPDRFRPVMPQAVGP